MNHEAEHEQDAKDGVVRSVRLSKFRVKMVVVVVGLDEVAIVLFFPSLTFIRFAGRIFRLQRCVIILLFRLLRHCRRCD